MFKNILVPTDLTERSFKAVEVALSLAADPSYQITLLHVIETIDDAEPDEFEKFYEKLNRRADRILDRIIDRYSQQNLVINKRVTFGKRVKEIIRFAVDEKIDLIVLSSHRIDAGNLHLGWGTISYKVGILSHCPVMLVKQDL
ncbi:MAG: universal stress protein [Syntrophobacteraceae bacterium]|nr:universal stress protein [Syntrophobacteraceae bacterium]